jgi:hypothetical protein
MEQFQHLYDSYLIKPANSIVHDPFREHFIKTAPNFFKDIFLRNQPVDVQDEFLEIYPNWINSSELNNFSGLNCFPFKYISLGVTQALDDFISFCIQRKKPIRMFKGEYPYARESINADISFIDDMPLVQGDAVIISAPFSATGNIHKEWCSLIKTCNELGIPVFVDCAFFGSCMNIKISFDEPCIDTVAFSPTKGLNCGYTRTGIAFTHRKGKETTLDLLTDWHHGIHLHTAIALELMRNFGPDTIPRTYRESQLRVCEEYNLIPSNSIHLGIGNTGWEYFTRDGVCNRIGLRNAIYDCFRK